MTREQLKTLQYYAGRVGKPGPWVIMPLESAHTLQKLAGEDPSPHPFNACRVDKQRIVAWLRKIADKHSDAPQTIEGGW